MKQTVFGLLVLIVTTTAANAQPINVMSWNIRYDNPNDGVNGWPNRKDWVAEIVTNNKIDLAGFQEVLVSQFDDLKQRLSGMDAYGVGRDDGQNAGEFAPIFYRTDRFKLLEKSTFWLSPTPETPGSKGWDASLPRIASYVKLEDVQSSQVLYVVNTHFDHRGEQARMESAALLVRSLRQRFADVPVVLTGDLNTGLNSPPYRMLVTAGEQGERSFLDTFDHSEQKPVGPDSTWNGFKEIVPGQRIDFVMTTSTVRTLSFQILTDRRGDRFPSDHLPVVTRLELIKK